MEVKEKKILKKSLKDGFYWIKSVLCGLVDGMLISQSQACCPRDSKVGHLSD